MLIRGWDKTNPVLLFLHGGPGAAIFPRARKIGVITKLEQHFVVVYWEQRGAGKSYHPSIPHKSMNIGQFIQDTHDVVVYLAKQFNTSKIFLVGKSWGSMIGLLVSSEYPDLFYAYVGIGQSVYPLKNDSISYRFTLEKAKEGGNSMAIRELEKTGFPPYNFQRVLIQRKWLTKFDKIIMSALGHKTPSKIEYIQNLLSTPEYSMFEIIRMGMDPFFSIKHLWNEDYYKMNLFSQVSEIKVPVYFISGKYDFFSVTELVEEYYRDLIAPEGKQFIVFENSGHEPELQEPDKFYDVLVNQVLKEDINEDN